MAFIDERAKLNAQLKAEQEIPLNTPWTFWIDRTDCRGLSAADYEQNLKKIYTVDTVQKFWQVFNNIPQVSELNCNFSYHLMREQYRPIREDPVHHNGGAWRIKCHNKDTPIVWKELLIAAIGEQLTDPSSSDELLGVSVAVREREDMVQLWHSKSSPGGSQIIARAHKILPRDVHVLTQFYKAHSSISSNSNNSHHNNGHHHHRDMRVF